MQIKTVLLTGATGFLGSNLLDALIKEKYNIVVLKRSTSDEWRINHLLGQYISYDVDIQPLEKVFLDQTIDCVIHTACTYGRNNESINNIVDVNLMFGLKILDACINFKTKLFFNTDTFFNKDGHSQQHLNIYTLSKRHFTEWLMQQSDKFKVVNFKLEHIYGPKDDPAKFIPWVVNQFKKNVPEIQLTGGLQRRDFIYIDDVVSAYLAVLQRSEDLGSFSEYSVGTGQSISVKNFLMNLKESYETDFGSIQTKLSFGALPYCDGEIMNSCGNNFELEKFGWRPKTLMCVGIKKTLNNLI
jgi:CDP-paratose synthetase